MSDVFDPDNVRMLPELRRRWEQNRRADATQTSATHRPVSGDLEDWLPPDEMLPQRLRHARTLMSRLIRALEDPASSAGVDDARQLLLHFPDDVLTTAVEAFESDLRRVSRETVERRLVQLDLSDEAFERYRAYLRRVREEMA